MLSIGERFSPRPFRRSLDYRLWTLSFSCGLLEGVYSYRPPITDLRLRLPKRHDLRLYDCRLLIADCRLSIVDSRLVPQFIHHYLLFIHLPLASSLNKKQI
jgi:hypothetical protein